MRRTFGILILGLMTALAGLAEGKGPQKPEDKGKPEEKGKPEDKDKDKDKDDHEDKRPVRAGYAVITPSEKGTGLVVFETFGLRGHGNDGGASQAGVLPPGLTTNAVLFVESSGRLSKNLGVAIVNPNDVSVNVSLTLRKSDGAEVATTSINVPSHQQVSKFVTELFSKESSVPSEFTGMLDVMPTGSSPMPISVIGLRFRGSNFSTLPATSVSTPTTGLPSFSTGVGGNGAVLLPQFAAGGGWVSEIVLANAGTSTLTVRVDLFNADGTALETSLNGKNGSSFTELKVPAGGVLTLAPRDNKGDDDF